MPTYEYRCKDCSHQFDVFQAFTDDALAECPECQGRLKKVFGNVGITFKGSGFYKTDSRTGGSSGESSTEGSKDSTSSKESSSGSESTSTSSKAEGTGSKDGGSTSSGSKDAKGSSSGGSKAPASSAS